ncbi:MAG TPA: hybrid sensor histidine kinase/response regulator [Rudaea sp.]
MTAETGTPPVRCLIVDDLEENLIALSALLRTDDVDVLAAKSGVEALELLLANEVALCLIDVQMPEMDGFELAELIRGSERTRHVPLIFVTAGEREQRRVFKGYESGAVDFLYKPIDPHILRSKAGIFFELYRQKQQLARDLHEKTEALRLNELFVGILGHDLRNPLTTVLTSAELLSQMTDPKIAKMGQWVLSSGQRMSQLIEDTLDLVRTRVGGGIYINAAPTDLAQVVQRVVDEQRIATPGRAIVVDHGGDAKGVWDAARLGQVASNLIGNAIKHGSEGAVRIVLRGEDDKVILTISNRGTIPPDVLPNLFDPFRGTRERDGGRHGGLGLGLYIVQQIVLAHGGTIEVTSGIDGTTTFRVELPRALD